MRLGKWKLFETTYVGSEEDPLIIRYQLFRCPLFGIWIHKMLKSDHDRALHDHPWSFISIILKGGYRELTDMGILEHKAGTILLRPAEWRHRVILEPGQISWNLILVSKRRRLWGFWPNNTWCWWRKYDTSTGICEEDILYTDNND